MEGSRQQGKPVASLRPLFKTSLTFCSLHQSQSFVAKHYLEAERVYTLGIDQHASSPDLAPLHLNRAAVNLILERYVAALVDSNHAVSLLANVDLSSSSSTESARLLEKALFRKAKALYALRRWSEARRAYSDLCS